MTAAAQRQPAVERIALQDNQLRLGLFHRALCGQGCLLVPYDDDDQVRQHPDTATTLRLPTRVPLAPAPLPPDAWFRVAVAHRAMHVELGTFRLQLDGPEPHFRRLRPGPMPGRPDLEAFFLGFPRPALAVELFTALEDLRMDVVARRTLPGLRAAYDWVVADELAHRPELSLLPPRGLAAELLVHHSLTGAAVAAPPALHEPVRRLLAFAEPLLAAHATVQTTAEATIRAYGVLVSLPNLGAVEGAATPVRMDDGAALRAASTARPAAEELRLEGDEVFDLRFVPVRYRDVPGPRYLGQQASGMPMREAILRMTAADLPASTGSDELSLRSQAAEAGQVDVTDASRPAPPPDPLPHDHGPDLDGHHHPTTGSVVADGPAQHAYPEWDAVAGHYLPSWCLVTESRARAGTSDRSHREALRRHRHLLPELTRALERMAPAGRRRVLRSADGDDLDLDACIDAMIDLRRRLVPTERVFTEVVRDRRDVVVAFALDLSSSTAERLPPDPRRPSEVRRVLDVEREAVALLMTALDRVGDAYGVYGFSGTGRRDVRVSTVKAVEERRTPAVLRRLEGLRPDHTTRMGPAIRHLTRLLQQSEIATKLLLVVSDGRPFDLDYGQQYGEEAVLDYAVQDTGRALVEAREAGVRPYLVTVDATGADYLGSICRPTEYHVLSDPRQLPASLAALYLSARGAALTSAGSSENTSDLMVPGTVLDG